MMEAGTATREKVLNGHAPAAEAALEHHQWQPDGTIFASGYGHRDFWTRRLLALADATGLVAALLLSAAATSHHNLASHMLLGALTLPAWIVIFKLYGLYDRDAKRVSHGTVDDLPWLFHALLVGALLSWLYFKLVGEQVPLAEGVTFGVTALAFILMLRFTVRSLGRHVLPGERVLLVGEEKITDVLVRKMRAHPEYGLDPVGVIRVSRHASTPVLPVVGDLRDLRGVVREGRIERIVVSALDLDATDQLELLRRCRELSVKVNFLPQVFDAMGPSVEIDDVEGVTLLGINPPLLSPSSRVMKRALDTTGSALLLILGAPLMLVTAIAIKLDSRGPVFFVQDRIGREGRPFRLLKFRTMCEDAESRVEELLKYSKDPFWLNLDNDPRLTRVGRFIRKLSLDELPQLWNVLRGEMSLVGPRPLVVAEDRQVGGWARSRLALTPGMTGSWQVLGRRNIPFEEMVKLDYLYVTNWSLWTDVRLILRTVPAVLMRRGAN